MSAIYEKSCKENRYGIGKIPELNKLFFSIPVTSHFVDSNEYYEISEHEYLDFLNNSERAKDFAERCRNRLEDKRLILKPTGIRGIPK